MSETGATRYVIMDVDGGCDDAWAIMMLIKAEAEMHVKILAITCVAGNTTVGHVARNVARVLECVKRTDIPVYKGAAASLIQSPPTAMFHGVDGFGDILCDEPDMSSVRPENAIVAIHRLVNEMPHQVTLICVAPLTNIALALKTYDDFASNLHSIYLMGGNYLGIGNTSRPGAEFNFYVDPEAAHIVLTDAKCPITVLPWEAFTKRTFSLSMDWRHTVLGTVDHPMVRLMNPIEKAIWGDWQMWVPCDMLIVACLLWPEQVIRRQKARRCTVELHGAHTRGQMVVDHTIAGDAARNVTVVELLDTEACKRAILWSVNA